MPTPNQRKNIAIGSSTEEPVDTPTLLESSANLGKVHVRVENGRLVTVFTKNENDPDASTTFRALKNLNVDGTGEIGVQDLLDTIKTQQVLKQTTSRQRKVIVAMMIGLVLLFSMTLGASVWAIVLTKEMEVKHGTLVTVQGEPIRVQSAEMRIGLGLEFDWNRSKSADNGGLRRLDSHSEILCTMPRTEAFLLSKRFESGVTSFVVTTPCMGVFTVQVESSVPIGETLTLSGTSMGGAYAWEVACDAAEPTCLSSTVEAESRGAGRLLRGLAQRRLAGSSRGVKSESSSRGLLNRRLNDARGLLLVERSLQSKRCDDDGNAEGRSGYSKYRAKMTDRRRRRSWTGSSVTEVIAPYR